MSNDGSSCLSAGHAGNPTAMATISGKNRNRRAREIADYVTPPKSISKAEHDEGNVKIFFELNGQPRAIKVSKRTSLESQGSRPKADETNDGHVAAPMPGAISSISVQVDQRVAYGDVLLTMEAMKMETAIHSPKTGTVGLVYIAPGQMVDAKDLLISIEV